MGNRGNVEVKFKDAGSIFFYTHWTGSELNEVVANALIRGKERWDDDSYLARIVFCEMIKGHERELTGFGIAPFECEEGSPKVIIDTDFRLVTSIDGVQMDYAAFAAGGYEE